MDICCVGCGGIGSFLAEYLQRLIHFKQFYDTLFTFYDDDKVEMKNVMYQNFTVDDIDNYKVDALCSRFFYLNFVNKRCDINDLCKYQLVVLCADNNKIRREAYSNWIENKIPFIDARANGKVVGIFSNETQNYLDTIDDSSHSKSCQNPFQLEKSEIEFGNVIVAAMTAQCILEYCRNKKLPNDVLISF